MELNRTIFKTFKAQGLTLSSDANKDLIRVLSSEDDISGSLELIVHEIKDRIEKREITSSLIGADVIASIVAELSSNSEDFKLESTQLLDAFSSPKVEYDERQKNFRLNTKYSPPLIGNVESRSNMYRERLLLTQNRLLRSGRFSLQGISVNQTMDSSKNNFEISTVASLLGSSGIAVLLGVVTQAEEFFSPEEGRWFLEDLTGLVPLDFTAAKYDEGLYTEGCQVVVQGEYSNSVFKVLYMQLPQPEGRETFLTAAGIDDVFGAGFRASQMFQLLELEAAAVDTLFIFLSDVQLEKASVLENLRVLFSGYEDAEVYPIFVLMGSFVVKSVHSSVGRETALAAFGALADVISSHKRLAINSKFVLIPGPQDPSISFALPQRPIPPMLTAELKKKVPNISFASNPCRIRFYTQEIAIFRDDLVKRLQRHTVVPQQPNGTIFNPNSEDGKVAPAEKKRISQLVAEHIVCQSHLCPLAATVKPVHWEFDHSLRLSPLPHLLVLGDSTDHYHHFIEECQIANPGSFTLDRCFIAYRPASREVELCQLP